jgi:hypothetical protein
VKSAIPAHVPGIIARRAVKCTIARPDEPALVLPGYFAAIKTVAKLQSTGSFPFVTQSNIKQFFTLPDCDVRSGDVVCDVGRGVSWILYTDFSHSVSDVPAYAAFFALRANVQDVQVTRYAGTPGPAGGINKDAPAHRLHYPAAHFYRRKSPHQPSPAASKQNAAITSSSCLNPPFLKGARGISLPSQISNLKSPRRSHHHRLARVRVHWRRLCRLGRHRRLPRPPCQMIDPMAELLGTAAGDFRLIVDKAVRDSFYKHHADDTGTLSASIQADAGYRISGGIAIIEWFVKAGGSAAGAYYGWFLEYGTGRYADNPLIALAGYPGKPFNPLRPPAGSGWDIVGRYDGPRPGSFISHGLQPSHWFSQGVAAARAASDFYAAELNAQIAHVAKVFRDILKAVA